MLNDCAQADTATLLKVIAEQQATNHRLMEQITQLQNRLDKLLYLLYGTKSEKQGKAATQEPESKSEISLSPKTKNSEPALNGRRPLPPELPRLRIEHDLSQKEQYCNCGFKMHRFGQVVTEQLDFKPAELFVKQHVRFKYACRNCDSLRTANLPPQQ